MHIVNIVRGGKPTLAARRDGQLVDLSIADRSLPKDLLSLLQAGPGAVNKAKAAAKKAGARAVVKGAVRYLPPIPAPPKIICIGLNYIDHAAESPYEMPKFPTIFLRVGTTLVAHNQPLIRPKVSEQFDYEGEMVVVIGRKGRHLPLEKALSIVAGYSIFNEGSVRDWQFKSPQWDIGKNFDASGGFGPDFVTADELPAGASGLRLQTRLNGQVVQNANTRDMAFDVKTLISNISDAMTLLPGDIIVSGTPSGVGFARKPPLWMKPGDVCEVEIEGIGTLSNPIRMEK
jgi:2-keto-4-pentenoate hydratase/2-oxohepta-3-ene-1,7-dioic acid hydratase in catechol pathway